MKPMLSVVSFTRKGGKRPASRPAHRHWDLAHRTRGQPAAITTSGQAMDPHEMVIKNLYTHISIPRAHLRPDLGPGEASRSELPPLPVGSCAPEPICLLRPTDELPGPKGTEGAWQRPAGLGCASQPPVGHGDDIAHHCCCCPCCSCCHCPRFCRCHNRCCCVLS